MYEKFFQLSKRPFAAAPLADRYFPARSIELARQTLARGIERAEGAGLLVGPAGTGKSLVLQVLAEQFRDQFAIALLTNGHLTTRRALLQVISFELGLPYRNMEEGDLRLSLIDHLAPSSRCPHGMLLLIDEAHRLPIKLMEEIRMITNLVRNGQPRVRLVLAGGRALEERFARPELDSFSQRLASRCYLEALGREETAGYVRSQLAALGGDGDRIFTTEALESVYQATDGIPRLINQLCDHALLLAYAGGSTQIDKAGISEAWSDLQQLPTPWNESDESEASTADQASVIEFGELDDGPLPAPSDSAPRTLRSPQVPTPFTAPGSRAPDTSTSATLRLDQISNQLDALEHEFEPAGIFARPAAGPPADDPFAEPFAQEEVIVDRYAAADALRTQPVVRSAEGRVLGAMLEPYQHRCPAPSLCVAAVPENNAQTDSAWEPGVAEPSDEPSENPHPAAADDPVYPEEVWEEIVSIEPLANGTPDVRWAERYVPAADQPIIGVPLEPGGWQAPPAARPVESRPAEDVPPLIIVEDDPQVQSPPHAAGVRRQEYGQLFANLRRS